MPNLIKIAFLAVIAGGLVSCTVPTEAKLMTQTACRTTTVFYHDPLTGSVDSVAMIVDSIACPKK